MSSPDDTRLRLSGSDVGELRALAEQISRSAPPGQEIVWTLPTRNKREPGWRIYGTVHYPCGTCGETGLDVDGKPAACGHHYDQL